MKDQRTLSSSVAEESAVCSMNSPSPNDDNNSNLDVFAFNKSKSVKKTKCRFCGLDGHSMYERRQKCPVWGSKCENCGILNHNKYACLKPKRGMRRQPVPSVEFLEILAVGEVSSVQILVQIKPENCTRTFHVNVFPDPGATICLMGPYQLKAMGLQHQHLHPCAEQVAVAGGMFIKAVGWVRITCFLAGRSTTTTVYFSNRVKRFFLSKTCCRDLGIISDTYPNPQPLQSKAVRSIEPTRLPPSRPSSLPFEPNERNIPLLKEYLFNSFEHSSFNRNPPFPKLSTPPATIHLKPDHVVPQPAYTPAAVAEHWAKEVKDSLDRDVAAGILVKVPLNEPAKWCARMVVVKKSDGRPRRTVDFQKLNKQCLREPQSGQSPFHTARQIPPNTWKCVFDAVDGYHAVELDSKSSKLTTFITPWGRYRYLRFPQGHCAAGDAFVGRVQQIMSHTPRMVRIVDDMCIFDNTIEECFWHAWEVLETCARHGIVINKQKFQFCLRDINFAGLSVTSSGVKPSQKILTAIRDFPAPVDLTQARSFFGMVNQVQWAYANSSAMTPFRELVKPNSKFIWTAELLQLFEESKRKILAQVEAGVRQYDIARTTGLQTDFSQEGLGYLLLQKFCSCSLERSPLCCKNGWQLVYAGSRFTKGAEKQYPPTHGEALAVVWALEHARVFTQGCKDLIIFTDHEPLLGILNDKPFTDIKHSRLKSPSA